MECKSYVILLGGKVANTKKREFGKAEIKLIKKSLIFNGIIREKNHPKFG